MDAILKRLRQLSDDELLSVSEAIDMELELRLQRQEEIPDSSAGTDVLQTQPRHTERVNLSSTGSGLKASRPASRTSRVAAFPGRHQ